MCILFFVKYTFKIIVVSSCRPGRDPVAELRDNISGSVVRIPVCVKIKNYFEKNMSTESEHYSEVDLALCADNSPEPRQTSEEVQTPQNLKAGAFYDAERRTWMIRVQGVDVVEVVPKDTKDSQLYKLYWEANQQLISLGMKLEATQAELQQVLRSNEKLHLENMMLVERVGRVTMENKIQAYEHRKEDDERQRDFDDLKNKYNEYRQTTKTLVTHMNQQKKKAKRAE